MTHLSESIAESIRLSSAVKRTITFLTRQADDLLLNSDSPEAKELAHAMLGEVRKLRQVLLENLEA